MKMFVLVSSLLLSLLTFTSRCQQVDFDKAPAVAWRFKTKNPVFSSPIISDNAVYFGGLDSTVYAVELATGILRWKLKTNGEIRSTLTVEGEKIYLVGGNGVLSCIHKNTGKPIWRKVFDNTALYIAERKYDFADYFTSGALLHRNILFFGSGSGKLFAFHADTGDLLWSYQTSDMVHSTPVALGDKVYFGSFDGHVYALNLQSGTLVWKFRSIGQQYFPKGEMAGFPVIANNSILIGSRDFNLYALDANEGRGNWNKKFDAGWSFSLTPVDTVLYVGTAEDRLMLALDIRNGREIWKTNLKLHIFGRCAVSPTLVYVPTIWGKLFALDRKSGTVKWSFSTDGYLAHHDKYFNPDDTFGSGLYKVVRSSADLVGIEYKMGGIFSAPAISGDYMVITTTEGIVYGLKKN
jgi:outer membrane protein assembly factor BamB